MPIKSLLVAFVISLIGCIPLYLAATMEPQVVIEPALVPVFALYLFVLTLTSSLLAARSSKRTPDSSADHLPAQPEGPREQGSVKWFNASKGFGFITRDSGDDVFVHFRSIRGQGHRTLHDGQRVEFFVSKGNKGLQAEDVAISS